jgi:hypothetical protein
MSDGQFYANAMAGSAISRESMVSAQISGAARLGSVLPAPEPVGEIPAAMECLEGALSALEVCVVSLEKKLAIVTAQPHQTDGIASGGKSGRATQLADKLDSYTSAVYMAVNRLDDIRNRLGL